MLNKFIFIGNLAREPEVKTTSKGTKIVNFVIATHNKALKEDVLYKNGVAFGHQADYIEKWCHKGDTVWGLGRLKPNNFVNKSGGKVYSDQIVLDEIRKLHSPKPKEDTGAADNESFWSGVGGTDENMFDDMPIF